MNSFIMRGDICFTKTPERFNTYTDGYVVCIDGKCAGVFEQIPAEYKDLEVIDHSGMIIIPGYIDLHTHAAQYANIGTGMEKELLDWLDTLTFPEEMRFKEIEYASSVYKIFVKFLKNSSTTRAVIFGTMHIESTKLLMSMLNNAGLAAYVGKVTMDRDAPLSLLEKTDEIYSNLEKFILDTKDKYENVKPIVTPRFIPSCTDEASKACAELAKKYNLPVQSHLCENRGEIELVAKLCPEADSYTDAYVRRGLINKDLKTVMAHCVYLEPEEIQAIKESGVFIAHCPQSNMNICSGVAPILKYLNEGLNIGLGTDVSAGANLEMECAIVDTIGVSKLLFVANKETERCLKLCEAFYLATKGGGKFFGKVGSFEKGYDFDAVVIDDRPIKNLSGLNLKQRLERSIYHYAQCEVIDKYVAGKQLHIDACN